MGRHGLETRLSNDLLRIVLCDNEGNSSWKKFDKICLCDGYLYFILSIFISGASKTLILALLPPSFAT